MATQTRAYWKSGAMNFYDSVLDTTWQSGVWADCPLLAIQSNPHIGYICFEDFTNIHAATLAGYTATQATTGTFTLDTTVGGVALLDSNSNTAAQGINVQKLGECFVPAANKDIWFEAAWHIVDTYDDCELFVGLSAADTSIIAGSDMTAANHVGFECHTDDGVVLFGSEKANVEATPATALTIAEATQVRTGFKINGVTSVEHWENGVKASTTHLTANIPVVAMTPSFVCHSGGTADPIMHLDWHKTVQLR